MKKDELVLEIEKLRQHIIGLEESLADKDSLIQKTSLLASIVESSDDAIIGLTVSGAMVSWNMGAEKIFGYASREVFGSNISILVPSDSLGEFSKIQKRVLSGQHINNYETTNLKKDGTPLTVVLSVSPILGGTRSVVGIAVIIRDITQRKQAEMLLKQSEEKYRSIFENVVEGIFQTEPEGRFISVNPAMARIHGFGSPEEMMRHIVDIGEQLYVDPEDRKRYRAVLQGSGAVKDFEAQVYRRDGRVIWTSVNSRAVRDAAGNVLRFEGTAEDITERKKYEEEFKRSTQRLRKNLIGTIQVISTMLETRDPYTAGHQKRVSSLARSIAQEMNLSPDTVDVIRMAGSIHDIGKMSVPGDILSKPARLNDIEMQLIRTHPQTGYDILKVVDLPPLISEIVLQHHERLDGSGYPRGLKNREILVEAQILSVADVIEAMVSHRPYRPAITLDIALHEIEKNKGEQYHPEVVETCLQMFKEKGFRLE